MITLDEILEIVDPVERAAKFEAFLEPLKGEQLSTGFTYHDLAVICASIVNGREIRPQISLAKVAQVLNLNAGEAQGAFDRFAEMGLMAKSGDGYMMDRLTSMHLKKIESPDLASKLGQYWLDHPYEPKTSATMQVGENPFVQGKRAT